MECLHNKVAGDCSQETTDYWGVLVISPAWIELSITRERNCMKSHTDKSMFTNRPAAGLVNPLLLPIGILSNTSITGEMMLR